MGFFQAVGLAIVVIIVMVKIGDAKEEEEKERKRRNQEYDDLKKNLKDTYERVDEFQKQYNHY